MELREQFTLASGVSQSMTPFKSKPRGDRGDSPTSSVSGDTRNGGMQGPITKVSAATAFSQFSLTFTSHYRGWMWIVIMIITIIHSLSEVSIQSRQCTVHTSKYMLHLYS